MYFGSTCFPKVKRTFNCFKIVRVSTGFGELNAKANTLSKSWNIGTGHIMPLYGAQKPFAEKENVFKMRSFDSCLCADSADCRKTPTDDLGLGKTKKLLSMIQWEDAYVSAFTGLARAPTGLIKFATRDSLAALTWLIKPVSFMASVAIPGSGILTTGHCIAPLFILCSSVHYPLKDDLEFNERLASRSDISCSWSCTRSRSASLTIKEPRAALERGSIARVLCWELPRRQAGYWCLCWVKSESSMNTVRIRMNTYEDIVDICQHLFIYS